MLGYFSGGEVTKKRIVIGNQALPNGYWGVSQKCQEDTVWVRNVKRKLDPKLDVITTAIMAGNTVIAYYYTASTCTDCRYEGGTLVKPDYMK